MQHPACASSSMLQHFHGLQRSFESKCILVDAGRAPARSTRWRREVRRLVTPPSTTRDSTTALHTQCERLDAALARVPPTWPPYATSEYLHDELS